MKYQLNFNYIYFFYKCIFFNKMNSNNEMNNNEIKTIILKLEEIYDYCFY